MRVAAVALVTCVFCPFTVPCAQAEGLDSKQLLQRLRSAEQRISELEISQTGFGWSSNESAGGSAEPANDKLIFNDLETERYSPRFYVGYERGFLISPIDERATPFEIKVNGRMQFRYVGFSRDRDIFRNRGGVVPVASSSAFEIERGRLGFRGFFYDPKLGYFINIDADTDDNHRAIFYDFWVSYAFSEACELYVGKRKVPGSYDWMESSMSTRFADRSMSTTFFRPDCSLGVWVAGKPTDQLHFQVAVVNGFNTLDLTVAEVDDQFAYAAMVYWDPLDDVGSGYSDLEHHDNLAIRVGNAFTYANQDGADDGSPTRESRFARLSDGTLLTNSGALIPGVTVNEFDVYLHSVFLTAEWCGFSFNAECFARWLQNFGTSEGLPLPHSGLFDSGFYAEFGYMLIPQKVEINAPISQVDGLFGDAWEYVGGVNWFINGTSSRLMRRFSMTTPPAIPAQILKSDRMEYCAGPNIRRHSDC